MGELEDWVKDRIDEGYSRDEIKEYLTNRGYRESIIEDTLERFSFEKKEPRGKTWKIQRYSWLGLYVLLLAGYLLFAFLPPKNSITSFPLKGLAIFISPLSLIHLGLGLYQLVGKRRLKEGLLSIGGFGFSLLMILLFVLSLRQFQLSNLLMNHTKYLGSLFVRLLPYYPSFLVAGVSLFAFPFFKDKMGKYGLVFFGIFLVVFTGLFTAHYFKIKNVSAEINEFRRYQFPYFPPVLYETDSFESTVTLPPPFYKSYTSVIQSSRVGSLSLWWNDLEKTVLGGHTKESEKVCGGSIENFEDKFGEESPKLPFFVEEGLLKKMKRNKEKFVNYYYEECKKKENCTLNKSSIRDRCENFVNLIEKDREMMKELLGFKNINFENLRVDDCNPPPSKYYGLKLADLSCEEGLIIKLRNVGTRPISSNALVSVYSQNSSDFSLSSNIEFKKWKKGTRTFNFTKRFSEKELVAGDEYIVDIIFTDIDLRLKSKCKGKRS